MTHPAFRWAVLLPTPLVNNLATLGPLGYLTKAPGTMGSVAGVLWYSAVFHFASPMGYLLLLAVSIFIAIGICGEAEQRMFKRDPGEVVLDEFVCIPVCFIGLQGAISAWGGWAWCLLLAGFLLFRLFDITKPLIINRMQNLPGGVGVVADDFAAALATCLCLHILVALVG